MHHDPTPVRRSARLPKCARGLSRREVEVLCFLAAGYRDRAIAAELAISRRTVTTHVTSILAKLGAESRVVAAIYAVRQGLV